MKNKNSLRGASLGIVNEPISSVYIDPRTLVNEGKLINVAGLGSRRCEKGNRYAGVIVPDNCVSIVGRFDDNPHVIALRQRFVDGLDWKQTEYSYLFHSWWRRIKNRSYSNWTWTEFETKKLVKWDFLYENIRSQGYINSPNPLNEVEIAVNHCGQLLFIDGRHRVFFARLLGISRIPVIVNFFAQSSLPPGGNAITPHEILKLLSTF